MSGIGNVDGGLNKGNFGKGVNQPHQGPGFGEFLAAMEAEAAGETIRKKKKKEKADADKQLHSKESLKAALSKTGQIPHISDFVESKKSVDRSKLNEPLTKKFYLAMDKNMQEVLESELQFDPYSNPGSV